MSERRFESADGLNLFYRDFPGHAQATPVLCLPGLSRNSRDFLTTAQRISPAHRVLCPDLRGRGFSDWDPEWRNYHPGTYVEDCLRLLEQQGIESVIVIGTSLGGLMAMVMTAMRPEVVAGVVLNDVGPEVAPEGVARIRQYIGKLPPVSSWEEAAHQAETIYGAALPHIDDWEAYARLGYRENDDGVPVLDMDPEIGTAARELEGTAPDLWPVFGALSGRPVLVLRGENSDILSVATLEKMQSAVPGLEAVTVPGCGHAPTLDEPVCIEAIDRLLSKTET